MGGTPATLIARWPSADPRSATNILARSITSGSKGGVSQGRRAVQIRSLRLPASETNGKEGRNMYIVRALDGTTEKVDVVVEDPSAVGNKDRKGKGKAKQEDGDEVMFMEAETQKPSNEHTHGRWTFSSIAQPSGSSASSSAFPGPAALFDTFVQRTLFAQPLPGSAPAPSGTPASGFWQPRAAAVTIEGFAFTIGGNTADATGDWEVKVGSVLIKGGTSAGTAKGCIIEVSYLPVPYLPANSTYVKDFLLSLFPPIAVRNGEIEIIEVDEDAFQEAGLLDTPDKAKGEEEGEWEWRDKHTSLTYVTQFKKEGIL
ncbi:hypothetical protein JCM11251_007304 [Rhodosporidiobolus azoricus]